MIIKTIVMIIKTIVMIIKTIVMTIKTIVMTIKTIVMTIKIIVMNISGEASPTIWSCYANFKSSLLISLEIDCFHGR